MRRSARPTTSTASAGLDAARGAGAGFSPSDAFGDIFGDMFGDIFGGGRRGGRNAVFRGADLRYELALDLEQAVFGTSTEIDFQTVKECTSAAARAPRAGTRRCTCETCRRRPGADQPGHLRGAADLPALQGPRLDHQGSLPEVRRARPHAHEQAPVGQGAGRRRQRRPHPARGRGRSGPERRARRATSMSRSSCGSTRSSSATARTFPAKCRSASRRRPSAAVSRCRRSRARPTIKVPAGTQSGRVFRLREKGIKPVRGGSTGDLFCRVVVETPVDLGARAEGTPAQVRGLARCRRQAAQSAAAHLARGRAPVLRTHGELT